MEDASEMPFRRGRGARSNPANRFTERQHIEDPAALDADERRQIETTYTRDPSRSLLAKNDSPDIPFTYSLNPYRGCENGCSYCYARPTHEYLGFSAGIDFETRIFVKEDAPALLSQTFQKPSWTPEPVAMSGVTDPYQPAEREKAVTRGCLKVFLRHRNPVSIITKSGLIRRDVGLLAELAERALVHVFVSITSLDDAVAGAMEPRAARPQLRLQAVETLAEAGVPVGVHIAPVVPGLTDEELPAILQAAADAGAQSAGYQILRLPGAVESLFIDWLETHFPHRANRVLRRVRSLRDGALNETAFGDRMRGHGIWADTYRQLFRATARKTGLDGSLPPLSTDGFRRLKGGQQSLFGG
jgi:DNA repair photolyase